MEESGYRAELENEGEEEAESRMENIGELINKATSYWNDTKNPTLEEFLEEVSLVADIDQLDQRENRVTLMTLHSAKGLEFENVYLSGMEEGFVSQLYGCNVRRPREFGGGASAMLCGNY